MSDSLTVPQIMKLAESLNSHFGGEAGLQLNYDNYDAVWTVEVKWKNGARFLRTAATYREATEAVIRDIEDTINARDRRRMLEAQFMADISEIADAR